MANRGGRGNRASASMKVLAGNPGRRPIHEPPHFSHGVPEPPDRLPEGARRYWEMLAPLLARVGLLTEADAASLADMAMCFYRLEQAEELLEREGLVVTTPRGLRKHPAAQLAKEYRQAAQNWVKRFGLDPHSRGALDVVPQDVKDELAELLEGGR